MFLFFYGEALNATYFFFLKYAIIWILARNPKSHKFC